MRLSDSAFKKQKKMEQRKFKVIEILALQSGTSERGEWKSQEVILEEVQNVQYPDPSGKMTSLRLRGRQVCARSIPVMAERHTCRALTDGR